MKPQYTVYYYVYFAAFSILKIEIVCDAILRVNNIYFFFFAAK